MNSETTTQSLNMQVLNMQSLPHLSEGGNIFTLYIQDILKGLNLYKQYVML